MKDYHQAAWEEVADYLRVDAARGLSSEEAGRRLAQVGANALAQRRRRSHLRAFLGHRCLISVLGIEQFTPYIDI